MLLEPNLVDLLFHTSAVLVPATNMPRIPLARSLDVVWSWQLCWTPTLVPRF
jgi:hypothetical protein